MAGRTFQLLQTVYRTGKLMPKHILHEKKFQSRNEAKEYYYANREEFDTIAYSIPQHNFHTRINSVVTA